MTLALFIIKIVLAVLALASSVFIVVVVMKQKGNTDGMEAMMGGSTSDESESYFEENSASRKEARLKRWTYICSAVLAVSCIVFLILL